MNCACHDPAVFGHVPPCPGAGYPLLTWQPGWREIRYRNLPLEHDPWLPIPEVDYRSHRIRRLRWD